MAIAQNPYSKKPKELWKILDQGLEKDESDKFDRVGMDRLKDALRKNPRFMIKD